MGRLFVPNAIGLSSHKLFGQLPQPAASGFNPLSLTVGGPNSFGPLNPAYTGDGSGFNTQSFGTGGQMGTLNGYLGTSGPPGPSAGPWDVAAMGWEGGIGQAGAAAFFIAAKGTLAQNAFTQIALGAPAGYSFLSANVQTFDTTSYPGFSIWIWTDAGHEFSYIGQTLTVTLS